MQRTVVIKDNAKHKEQRTMNTPNEDRKQTDNMELLKQPASACGPGCGCNASGTPGKSRWVIGVIVLVAAGVLVARDIIKSDGTSSQTSAPAFASLAALPTPAGDGGSATNAATAAPTTEKSMEPIGALAELNAVAAKLDAVFVFLPGKEGTSSNLPAATMNKAARTIEAQGKKIGLFTLLPSSHDYDQIEGKISLPAVLAMAKGRGMNAISGDITETKLVQGYLAASSAGGCGPSAGAGCCPKK
jgi:MYXO-CTERM domain-containing protein